MEQQNDSYDFSRPSQTGKGGFELFVNEKDGRFYFHFNDESGQALLFSQGYTTKKGRDNGIRSVKKNGSKAKHYEVESAGKGKGCQVVLRAGNHLEIARSPVLADRKAAQTILAQLHEAISDLSKNAAKSAAVPKPSSPSHLKAKKWTETREVAFEVVEKSSQTAPKRTSMPLSKHAFRIEFYRPSEAEPLIGRIENLAFEEKQNFAGFDERAMLDFMRNYLPAAETVAVEPAKEKAAEVSPMLAAVVHEQKKPAAEVGSAGKTKVQSIPRIVVKFAAPASDPAPQKPVQTVAFHRIPQQKTETAPAKPAAMVFPKISVVMKR